MSDSHSSPERAPGAANLNARAWEKREGDRPAALELAAKAEDLALEQGSLQEAAHSLVTRAFVAFRESRYDAALEQAFRALEVLEGAPKSV